MEYTVFLLIYNCLLVRIHFTYTILKMKYPLCQTTLKNIKKNIFDKMKSMFEKPNFPCKTDNERCHASLSGPR